MKRIFLFLVILQLASGLVKAQNDTVIIHHPQKVTIVTNDSLQRIVVNGKEGDEKFIYQNTIQLVDSNFVSATRIGRDRWDLIPSVKVGKRQEDTDDWNNMLTLHLGVGFTNPTHVDSRIDFSTFKSWEFFITVMQWEHFLDRQKNNQVQLGLGVDWKNYRMTDDLVFIKGNDGNVTLENYPVESVPKFSRIKVFSLTATLRYEHSFGNGFSVGFGPVVNFNTYASIKTRYKLQGNKVKHIEKGIRQRPVTIDWMLNAEIAGFPFYVKYANDDVLKDGGVKFRSLSFGIYL